MGSVCGDRSYRNVYSELIPTLPFDGRVLTFHTVADLEGTIRLTAPLTDE